MEILIVGGGGREHALAWKALQSPKVEHVWVAPGNAGTACEPNMGNVDIRADDVTALLAFAQAHTIDLTIVGPEAALAAGITDAFSEAGLRCFGPTRAAAMLEISKGYSKDFMQKYDIPTAAYARFTDEDQALSYLDSQKLPIVIKADGLAAGKGVIIATDWEQARNTVKDMLSGNQFGEAGHAIVIEEFLQGEELSYIVMVDGNHILPLASSQDHKRLGDGDIGPNTGGMGAYSPAPQLTPELDKVIMDTIISHTIAGLNANGTPYVGFLYAGLMITPDGQPKVLEYNCRFGDPETQPIMMRLQSDLVALCCAALEGKLDQTNANWDSRSAMAVVMVAGGYPAHYDKGLVINGLESITDSHCKVFHAGTKLDNTQVLTNGGRVLAVTALGDDLASAQTNAYRNAQKIHWDKCFYRKDIGHRAL